MNAGFHHRASRIQLLAMDVDGVLTDGSIYMAASGDELKAFNILDGQGLKMLRREGVLTAFITGRDSPLTAARASNLSIDYLYQGREDKATALRELSDATGIPLADMAYMGDDLPDLAAIELAGLGITVPNGCATVREAADWCTVTAGGAGAVREICEQLLQARGVLQAAIEGYRKP